MGTTNWEFFNCSFHYLRVQFFSFLQGTHYIFTAILLRTLCGALNVMVETTDSYISLHINVIPLFLHFAVLYCLSVCLFSFFFVGEEGWRDNSLLSPPLLVLLLFLTFHLGLLLDIQVVTRYQRSFFYSYLFLLPFPLIVRPPRHSVGSSASISHQLWGRSMHWSGLICLTWSGFFLFLFQDISLTLLLFSLTVFKESILLLLFFQSPLLSAAHMSSTARLLSVPVPVLPPESFHSWFWLTALAMRRSSPATVEVLAVCRSKSSWQQVGIVRGVCCVEGLR